MYKTNLFKVPQKRKTCEKFFAIEDSLQHEPTRILLDEVYSNMGDIDGNFVEQFQTTGFDARIFELYLFAYFESLGARVIRKYDRPDFLIEKDKIEIVIEATTVNKSSKIESKDYDCMTQAERLDYMMNELPIRFGSALFSKLGKKYWELEQCKGKPCIIAIEAFFDKNALEFSSGPIVNYLYGSFEYPTYDARGNLHVKNIMLETHKIPGKEIPSGFFNLPEAEYVSAVLFTNAGTVAKFKRIGYQKGYYSGFMKIIREGACYDFDPNASVPQYFCYDLDNAPEEEWGEGLIICHNPKAKYPLEMKVFEDLVQYYWTEEGIRADIPRKFQPLNSKTFVLGYKERLFDVEEKYTYITKNKFDCSVDIEDRESSNLIEVAWLMNKNKEYVLTILQDGDISREEVSKIDGRYGCAIFKKEEEFYEPYKLLKVIYLREELEQLILNECL